MEIFLRVELSGIRQRFHRAYLCPDGPLAVVVAGQALQFVFIPGGELASFPGEELDPVVRVGVVRGAYDHRRRRPEARCQGRYAGRR